MSNTTIYSIGHGNKDVKDLVTELQAFNIEYLLDIRTKPFSKWAPQFNKEQIRTEIEKNKIKYIFIGNDLGGLPKDRSCYNEDGKVVYDLIREKEFFKNGLKRLVVANEKKINIAIMCSESKPEECHRSKLIGQALLDQYYISLNHIISSTSLKSQETVINELMRGKSVIDLFGQETDFKSRKAY